MNKEIKILITGSSGFIGKHLADGLAGRYELFAPGHGELDLLDERAVEAYLAANDFNVVIHCAAVGVGRNNNLPEIVPTNLRMFINLARCNKLFDKMIFLGSGAEYGKQHDLIKVREEDFDSAVPTDPYGLYKYQCSKFMADIPNIINLRVFAVFGSGEDYVTRFISNTICRSLFDLPVVINQDVKFDYFYIDDLINIIEYFIKNPAKHKFYNVGSGKSVTLTEIAKKIENISGKNLDISIKIPGWNMEYTCDNSRLLRDIPLLKFIPMDRALLELYNWYKDNLREIDIKKFEKNEP